jgi:hypothetical protein
LTFEFSKFPFSSSLFKETTTELAGAQDEDGIDTFKGDNKNTNCIEESVDLDTEEKLNKEWKETCEFIMNNPGSASYRDNLEAFLRGTEDRQVVQASLERTFYDAQSSLNNIIEGALACAVPVHEKICDKMSITENELLSLFQHNQELRSSLLQSLNSCNSLWQSKYEDFSSRVTQCNSNSVLREETIDVNVNVKSDCMDSSRIVSVGVVRCRDKEDEGLPKEPDWEGMMELIPSSRDKIEAFVNGCNSWNTACEQFRHSFDEIRQMIETSHTSMLQIVESAYVRINEDLDDVQIDIQDHIISNSHRRGQIEQSLQQVVQQQQSIFSRLMARVGGKSVKVTTSKQHPTDKSKDSSLRSLLPFGSIFPLSG